MPSQNSSAFTEEQLEAIREDIRLGFPGLRESDRLRSEVAATAMLAYDRGLNPMPVMDDGSKRPVGRWKEQTARRPSRAAAAKAHKGAGGTGILFGNVWAGDALADHGVELFEFDDADAFRAFLLAAEADGLVGPVVKRIRDGYEETTPSGGIHLIYYCTVVEGNAKLAQRPKRDDERRLVDGVPDPKDATKTLIETRGRGGFGIIAPSGQWTHPTGRPYVLERGGLDQIATITPDERRELFALARTFDAMPKGSRQQPGAGGRQKQKQERASGEQRSRTTTGSGTRPGDDFNRRATWSQVLGPHGWGEVRTDDAGIAYWRRPGAATAGHDATTNADGGDGLFVHSTSASPLEANRYYDKFSAYAALNHQSDFKAAAKVLRSQGYGGAAAGAHGNGPTDPSRSDPRRLTDIGNAERLAEQHREDHRYCAELKGWFTWDGTRWAPDVTGEMVRRAIETIRRIPAEADGETDSDVRNAIFRHAMSSENGSRVEQMVKLARNLEAFAVRADAFDRDPWLLNTPTGTLDMRKGELRPHDRADLITRMTGAAYIPGATSEEWDAFLVAATEGIDVASGDRVPAAEETSAAEELRAFLQRLAGMSATGDASEEVAPLIHGPEGSGKSTLIAAMISALGDYAKTTDFETFLKRKQPGGIRTDLVRLNRAYMVASVEVEDGRELAAALFKRVTGGDEQQARGLYTSEITIKPTATYWLVANHVPRVDATDGAMWRRILCVPFPHTVPKERRKPRLKKTLTDASTTGPAVLAWIVQGALAWQRHGLRVPESVTAATADLRSDMDRTSDFLEDRCVFGPTATVPVEDLHTDYLDWCLSHGIRMPLDRKRFGMHLSAVHGCKRARGTGGKHVWQGVRLVKARTAEAEPMNPFRTGPTGAPQAAE